MTIFVALCVAVAGIWIFAQVAADSVPVWHQATNQARFVLSVTMILATLAVIPLALKLFKLKPVAADLTKRKAPALKKWGVIRLLALGSFLLANLSLYYLLEEEPTFGWLSVILLLVLPFVVPTMSRCEAEVADDELTEQTPAART